jgi:L-lactate dehydrogenase complex protein LldF
MSEKLAWRLFKTGVLHRGLMNSASGKIKNVIFEKAFKSAWGERRDKLVFAPKSFNQMWKERNKKEQA